MEDYFTRPGTCSPAVQKSETKNQGRCEFALCFAMFIILSGLLLSGTLYGQQNIPAERKESTRNQSRTAPAVPILCYHNIRLSADKEDDLYISQAQLDQHLKMLRDNGFHSILPDQLVDHLTFGTPLPEKPVMLTFDDTHKDHYTIAYPLLKKYGFNAVFCTIAAYIGKKYLMNAEQVRELSDNGNVIANHSWDHPNMTKLKEEDWARQVDSARLMLEQVTGRSVNYFFYPYGAYNKQAIDELKKHGVKAAFQLMDKPDPGDDQLFTIRRLLVSGKWSPDELKLKISTFK